MAHAHTWDEFEPVGMRYRIIDKVALADGRGLAEKQPLPEVLTPRTSKRMQITPGHVMPPVGELCYFAVRARAEPLRLMLHYAGLAYTNRVVQGSEWPDMKPTTPKGQLPIFIPEDEEEAIAETVDIAKHIAGVSHVPGLLPADASAAESAYAMFSAIMSGAPFDEIMMATNLKPAADVEPKLGSIVAECVKELAPYGKQLKATFFGGDAPHFGDFAVFYIVDLMRLNDAKVLETLGGGWPSWFDAMRKLPGIEAYLESRPKANGGEVGFPDSRMATLPLDD